jgi:large subunit ribosomal protein L18
MYHVNRRKSNLIRRKLRVRKKIYGTAEKPRMSIHRSNRGVFAQLINDDKGLTMASASSKEIKVKKGMTKMQVSTEVGKVLAKKALEAGIKDSVFDRNGYRYHGRVKNIAEGAREGGLKI